MIFALIIANAIVQGVQSGLNDEADHESITALEVFDDITLLIFVVEIVLKWVDSFRTFWTDGWNVFDFFVTFASAGPRFASLVLLDDGQGSALSTITNQVRLFRSLRILKMIARLSSLRVVIATVIDAFQSLGFILLLLALLFYMFGIFAVNLFADYTASARTDLLYSEKFSDLPNAFVSLFQLLTL
jgi:cation channel sperm-associated protein 2